MNQKKTVRVIAILMAVIMLISLVVSVVPVLAFADNESDLQEIKQQKNQLAGRTKNAQMRVDELIAQQASVLEQKAAMDERNELVSEQITLVEEEIKHYEGVIEEKARELEAAQEREQEQLRRYRTRVRAMEESGGYNVLALVLQADDLASLMSAFDDMGEIMQSDRILEDQYIAAREEVEETKADFEETKKECEEKKAELDQEKKELEAQIEEASQLLAQLEEDIEKAKKEYEVALAAEEAMAAQISYLAQKIAQEAAAAAAEAARQQMETPVSYTDQPAQGDAPAENNGDASASGEGGGDSAAAEPPPQNPNIVAAGQATGTYVWPVPSSNLITSPYGNRVHPILGTVRFHSGIDINGFGNAGGSILASDGGVIQVAEYSDSYGNYVMINHGNGNLTLYAHMSAMYVSVGQTVSQGDVIGGLGETGWATGVHCHFEIYRGGERIDPESIFVGYPHYNC